ncbi:MAG: hypothetical protein U1E59_13915 [Amaricoccus sp.]
MPRFLAVYLGSDEARARSGWDALTDAERGARTARGVQAWGDWVLAHREAIVDPGSRLGRTKRVSGDGIADSHNALTAYVLVEADSAAAAAQMFERHPHFTIFPGDSVEIVECLPSPRG